MSSLYCSNNQFTNLDVSANPALRNLVANKTQLTSLDVSANPVLQKLECSYTPLTGLDVSANPALVRLNCQHNQLTSLNVQNGNNTILSFFRARYNPDLSCIQVDDPEWSDANWTYGGTRDSGVIFSIDCSAVPTSTDEAVPAGEADSDISTISVHPNPSGGRLFVTFASNVKGRVQLLIRNMNGQIVYRSLWEINPGKNNLSVEDLSLPNGIYLLQLLTDKELQPVKFIIQKE